MSYTRAYARGSSIINPDGTSTTTQMETFGTNTGNSSSQTQPTSPKIQSNQSTPQTDLILYLLQTIINEQVDHLSTLTVKIVFFSYFQWISSSW